MSIVTTFIAAKFLEKPTPVDIAFEITHRCNLDCVYCDRHTSKEKELETKEIIRIISEFQGLGTRSISLDGGEPLIRKDFPIIADFIGNLGIELNINSNGILIPDRLDCMTAVNKIKISIDGGKADAHDAMRGKGSFVKVVKGVEAAKSKGIRVELTCTLNHGNVDRLPEILDFAAQLDCQVIFQPARNSLFNSTILDGSKWLPDYSELYRGINLLLETRKKNKFIRNTKASLKHFLKFPNDVPIPCSAGWLNCTIDPSGNLYHCGAIDRASYRLNILQHGSAQAFKLLPRFRCMQCWCARTVEDNYLWGLKFQEFL